MFLIVSFIVNKLVSFFLFKNLDSFHTHVFSFGFKIAKRCEQKKINVSSIYG